MSSIAWDATATKFRTSGGEMSALSTTEMRPFKVRTALLVGGDLHIQAQLRLVLEPGPWAIQHAKDNTAALVLCQRKTFDLFLTSE
jgi:hypothetical protein